MVNCSASDGFFAANGMVSMALMHANDALDEEPDVTQVKDSQNGKGSRYTKERLRFI